MLDYPFLYHSTVRRPDAIVAAVFCCFDSDVETLAVAYGQWLEILELSESGELCLLARTNLFCTIRCLDRVHIPRVGRDQLILTSDSGELSLLDFDCKSRCISRFGHLKVALNKLSRDLPGEYLAVDPRGRVALVASISHVRTAAVLSSEGVASSVDCANPSTFLYSLTAVDRGFSNPGFACVERFRFQEKRLVLYELKLGFSQVSKVWSRRISDTCDIVMDVPGGREGSSGLLIIEGKRVSYCDVNSGETRASMDTTGGDIICGRMVVLDREHSFALLCTDDGSLTAIRPLKTRAGYSLELHVLNTKLSTLPVCISCSVSGLLFFNMSSGDHKLFQVSKANPVQLELVSELPNISPVISSALRRRQLLLGCELTKNTSKISSVQAGKSIEVLASTPLPCTPECVFATRLAFSDPVDRLIVLSYTNSQTVALIVDDNGGVGETSEAETGIAFGVRTLGIARLKSGLAQIFSSGIRYISQVGSSPTISPWSVPPNLEIQMSAFTSTQLVLALSNSTLVYFEERNGSLHESQQRANLPAAVTAMCFGAEGPRETRSDRLYVSLSDKSLRHLTLPNLRQKQSHPLSFLASSVLHCVFGGSQDVIFVGHINGAISLLQKDDLGTLVLGSAPVKLAQLQNGSVIALSSGAWLFEDSRVFPLVVPQTTKLTALRGFVLEQLPNGCIGVTNSTLEVLSLADDCLKLGTTVTQSEDLESRLSSAALIKSAISSEYIALLQNDGLLKFNDSLECVGQLFESSTTKGLSLHSKNALTNVRFESQEASVLAAAHECSINTFYYGGENGLSVHGRTTLHAPCSCLVPFQGRLLAALGNTIILYSLGKKQLLKVCGIVIDKFVSIRVMRVSHDLVFVGDSRHSVVVISWHKSQETFSVLAEDPIPRSVSSMLILDQDTVCVGSQFGDITILRLQARGNALANHDQSKTLSLVAQFWIPDAVVGLHRGVLSPLAGGSAVIYVGLRGTIGVLTPLISEDEIKFASELMTAITELKHSSCAGGSAIAYRNHYTPARNVIDGDVFEEIWRDSDSKKRLANELSESLEMSLAAIKTRIESIKLRSSATNV